MNMVNDMLMNIRQLRITSHPILIYVSMIIFLCTSTI